MWNRPLMSMTVTVLRKSGEPTMQGAVLWTHHQYPAGKLPNYQALNWERYYPPHLLSWLMHCYGMHIDANFEINITVVVIYTLNFSYHFRNLEDASGGYIWRYWRQATGINLDMLKEVIKFWSTVENSYNRQVDDVSLTIYVYTAHKHQPHASLSYLVTWLLLTSFVSQPLLHRERGSGEWTYFHLFLGTIYKLPMRLQSCVMWPVSVRARHIVRTHIGLFYAVPRPLSQLSGASVPTVSADWGTPTKEEVILSFVVTNRVSTLCLVFKSLLIPRLYFK